ncbi:radical SAM protein [Vibrio sp. Of14-4]|uniref:coproporphyrinogen-III oxidase family protein n=1 Tax=Vibrio sp. Of14-4 TaxID=2724878 RepID=UPI001EF2C899|nr:radical SAM protein [Vibrio sp. Of14-4]MCG7490297.1 radical SAM protein [Vibrio sp. Of14-4]
MENNEVNLLPEGYLNGKTALNYDFYTQAEVVTSGSNPPIEYSESSHRKEVEKFYTNQPNSTIYIHTPWCETKCTYCYYYKTRMDSDETITALIDAEQKHSDMLDSAIGLKEKNIRSIYFGGGTPTILTAEQLEQNLSFYVDKYGNKDTEVTCEASMSTLTPEKVDIAAKYATRLSVGLQTFDKALLKKIARVVPDDQETQLKTILDKIEYVNLDLIYGLQSQSMQVWLDTVKKAVELKVPSLTVYRLVIRANVPMSGAYKRNPHEFPTEEQSLRMYYAAKELLLAAGYRENLVGWFLLPQIDNTVVYDERWAKQTSCVGIGPGVHNYGDNHFYNTVDGIDEYIDQVSQGSMPIETLYQYDDSRKILWYMFSHWKSNKAVSKAELFSQFGASRYKWVRPMLAQYIKQGLISETENHIRVVENALPIIEWIIADILDSAFNAKNKIDKELEINTTTC